MIAKQILFEISKCHKGTAIDFRIAWPDIEREPLWIEQVNINNAESLVFSLRGHRPLTEVKFSEKKLMDWCKTHNIDCWFEPKDNMYLMTYRNN
tara:strand:+ start:11949 stop:12230 length:282 start_codon:yes stop_codon:yes gene_type:complete